MALRSIRDHFVRQNWAGFAIDLVIVVLGVYLGLEAANWNEERRDRALEHVYLERLQEDLEKTISENREQVEWNDQREYLQGVVLKALSAGELHPDAERDFQKGLLYLGFVGRPRLYWGTVEELKSSGNMQVISNPTLRAAVIELEGAFERAVGDAGSEFDRIAELRQPIDSRYAVREHLLSDENVDVDRIAIDYDFGSLANDSDVYNRISHVQFNTQLTAHGYREVIDATKRVKAMVDDELERFE